jgi:hypothetical protein
MTWNSIESRYEGRNMQPDVCALPTLTDRIFSSSEHVCGFALSLYSEDGWTARRQPMQLFVGTPEPAREMSQWSIGNRRDSTPECQIVNLERNTYNQAEFYFARFRRMQVGQHYKLYLRALKALPKESYRTTGYANQWPRTPSLSGRRGLTWQC